MTDAEMDQPDNRSVVERFRRQKPVRAMQSPGLKARGAIARRENALNKVSPLRPAKRAPMQLPHLPGLGKPGWMMLARCGGMDPRVFFPITDGDGSARGHWNTTIPKKVCKGCVVRDECLDYALVNNEIGIWGGTTDKDRREIKRKRRT